MSAETRQAMVEAIAVHVADENDGAILSDWIVSVSMNTLEALDRGENGYMTDNPDSQPIHASLGLAELAALAYRGNYENAD